MTEPNACPVRVEAPGRGGAVRRGRAAGLVVRGVVALACLLGLPQARAAEAPRAAAAGRYALVIGNSDYLRFGDLPNVRNDANDMCAALRTLAFQVECLHDVPSPEAFRTAVQRFVARVPAGADSVFYYAGHALQVAGENHLMPTTASWDRRGDPLAQFVRLSDLFRWLGEGDNGFRFIVLDACRNDPTAPAGPGAARGAAARKDLAARDALRGLVRLLNDSGKPAAYGIAAVRDAPANTLVLFATAAGDTALDGDAEGNGPLAKSLARQIVRPGQTVDELVRTVIAQVADETERRYGKRQSPSLYGTFARQFCFNGCPTTITPEQLEAERRKAMEEGARKAGRSSPPPIMVPAPM